MKTLTGLLKGMVPSVELSEEGKPSVLSFHAGVLEAGTLLALEL